MGYAIRTRNCAECGREITGRLPPVRPVTCIFCNIQRAISAAKDMAGRSGPYYDRWLQSRGPAGRPRRE